ncbi:MAG TPA: cytochrome c [Dyella sp.]|uniref:c-type cytochrome n=1 Tax=Dyella sp. TaxID=1869338 RepID=UPI002B781FF6|nr:cytochrome c [Dyella sp.]HTV86737.1 cytochrome c [Dyella sp.]
MKRAMLGLLCAASLMACMTSIHAQTSDNALYTPDTLHSANGEAIFHAICQGCHMPDAKGAVGAGRYPPLTGNPHLASAQYMAATILFGRHDMPSFKTSAEPHHGFFGNTELSDAQIAQVIHYIRTHFGNHYLDSITADEVTAMHPQDKPSPPKP